MNFVVAALCLFVLCFWFNVIVVNLGFGCVIVWFVIVLLDLFVFPSVDGWLILYCLMLIAWQLCWYFAGLAVVLINYCDFGV